MYLQRQYKHDPKGVKSPVVSGVKIKRISANGKQNFSSKLVKVAQAEGWLSVNDTHIILHDDDLGDINFKIVRSPGRYCCHCGEKLIDDPTGEAAREHVAQKHSGKKSPDTNNPSGYEMIAHYECVVDEG